MSSLISSLSSPTTRAALQSWQEDPRLAQMVQDLMVRAQQTDADISSQANSAYDAQRVVADKQIAGQLKRSLAANGVLPTGGLASQYQSEIANPIYDRLNAQRAQTELDLRNARDGVKQGVTSTLAGMDNNKNQFTLTQLNNQQQAEYQRQQLLAQAQYQQASLAQQAQLASQQLAAEQARAQQQAALAQAQLDYQKQSDAQSLAFQREQAQLANQRYYSNSSPSGSLGNGAAGGGSSFGFDLGANDTAQMRANYQNMVSQENLRSGRNADGSYAGSSSSSSPYPTTSNTNQFNGTAMNSTSPSGAMNSAIYAGSTARGTASGGSGWSTPTVSSFYTPPSSRDSFNMMPSSSFYF